MIRFRSLSVRLSLALLIPLILSAALIGAGDAWVTRQVVDYTSDRLLAGSVRAIAESVTVENGKVRVDLPPWSLGLLDSPQRDSVFYSVRQSGRTLTGYSDLPDFDDGAIATLGPVFRTLAYQDRRVRQAAEAVRVPGVTAPVIISVAQTLESRTAVRKTLMTTVGLIEAGLVGLVALLIWPAARWSLRPLEGLRRRLAERSDARDPDFTPVAVDDVPRELQPVVVAFNTLLGQLERSVDGVRRFTADASHQIRTPLTILKTHLTLLTRAKRSTSDKASLADALEAVDRLQRLIEQLLAMARAEAAEADGPQEADLASSRRRVGRTDPREPDRQCASLWRRRGQAGDPVRTRLRDPGDRGRRPRLARRPDPASLRTFRARSAQRRPGKRPWPLDRQGAGDARGGRRLPRQCSRQRSPGECSPAAPGPLRRDSHVTG
jgi:two-component system sensor histidine kinase TctE